MSSTIPSLYRSSALKAWNGGEDSAFTRLSGELLGRLPGVSWLKKRLQRRSPLPLVTALTDTDCGPACLAMVLAFHGRHLPLEELRTRLGTGRDGSTAASLLRIARREGLRGQGLRVELEDLERLPRGSVLHWQFHHYVVLDGVDGEGILICDPARGRRHVPFSEVDKAFTGVALTFERGEGFTGQAAAGGRFRALFGLLFRDRRLWGGILAVSLGMQALGALLPLLTGRVVDRVVPANDGLALGMLAGVALVAVILHGILSLTRSFAMVTLRSRLEKRLTLTLVEALARLPVSFFQRRSVGDLMTRVSSGATLREVMTTAALSAVLDGGLLVVTLGVLWVLHPGMGALTTWLGGLQVGLWARYRRRLGDLLEEEVQAQARCNGFQVEMLSAMDTLKAMGAEQRAVDRHASLFSQVVERGMARGSLQARSDSLLLALRVASPLALLLLGAWLVVGGEMSLGTMLALSAVAGNFLIPLNNLVATLAQVQVATTLSERMTDILQAPAEEGGEEDPGELEGEVELQGVSFRYEPEGPLVVDEVNLKIPAGQMVAVVGGSGSGKSTLASLLLGLHRPQTGRVRFDGKEMERLHLPSLRARLGVVPQKPQLFARSIRDNIALADPCASLERIRHAAWLAAIDEDIEAMVLGYETPLPDAGGGISGGQRQRLALARALLGSPRILVLDEATSSLDAVTEARIQERLATLNCTRIVIAHRLSTIRHADRIVVMEKGRIVEEGSHGSLMRRNGAYTRLVRAQERGDEGQELG